MFAWCGSRIQVVLCHFLPWVIDGSVIGMVNESAAPNPCSCSAKSRSSPHRWLGLAEDVPEYQRRDYVLKYYRLELPRLRHFWRLHNELGNMWTHLIAGLYMAHRFRSWVLEQDEYADPWSLPWPRIAYLCGVVGFYFTSLVVFGISVQYHWRMCTPERELLCWRCMDQSACLALVVVGYVSGIPMGFHCYPELRQAYAWVAMIVCILTSIALALIPKTHSTLISAVILAGAFVAVVPAAHWLLLSTAGRRATGGSFCFAIVCACVACLVFFKMFPECYAPGRFDLFGNSHQLWHVLIFLTIVKYGDCLTAVYSLTATTEYCTE
mmetsp:Transcript_18140/g.63734  ORF Transcript_18140/g.63734 Transcript_18140/m.63734 type:complete len:324 (+) Transcript_18140:39-1010(+)